MENVLKLTVKKDVFEKLSSGEADKIYLDANSYWIKRLANDTSESYASLKESLNFRTFDKVVVTYGKDFAEYPFGTIVTGTERSAYGRGIVVVLDTNDACDSDDIEDTVEDAVLEEVNDDDEICDLTTDLAESPVGLGEDVEVVVEQVKETSKEEKKEKDKPKVISIDVQSNLESLLMKVLDEYDENDKNFVFVKSPLVILTSNGRVFGTRSRININNEQEIRFNVGCEKLNYDCKSCADFVEKLRKYINELTKNNFVFVWKDGCKLIKNNDGSPKLFKLAMSIKRYR